MGGGAALFSLLFLVGLRYGCFELCPFVGLRIYLTKLGREGGKKGGTVVGGVGSTECRRDSTFFSREMISRSLFATVSL